MGRSVCTPVGGYLYFGFAEVDAAGELLAHESVRIVSAFEDALERDQLLTVERCPVPPWFDARLATRLLVASAQLCMSHTHSRPISMTLTQWC